MGIEEGVRLIAVQFSFSNPEAIPDSVRRLQPETEIESIKRHHKNETGDGYLILKPTENCSLVKLPGGLAEDGYNLVDAFYQERLRRGRSYHMVRFLFSREPARVANPDYNNFMQTQGRAVNAFDFNEMCSCSMWKGQVFSNLFYGNGGKATSERVVNIALVARKPLFRPDGTPVMVWKKNENGERVGDKPVPLHPEYYLNIKEVVNFVTSDID